MYVRKSRNFHQCTFGLSWSSTFKYQIAEIDLILILFDLRNMSKKYKKGHFGAYTDPSGLISGKKELFSTYSIFVYT